MGNSTGNVDKKSTTSKNDNTKEKRWNTLGQRNRKQYK